MPLAPQEIRTFFVTSVAYERHMLLQSDRMANLLIDVIRQNRKQGRFSIHEFVIMPNHFHLLITPAWKVSLERALQFIKGGFSYRMKRELDLNFSIWENGFTNHRIRDTADYNQHREYIHENPVEAKLVERADLFPYSSAYPGMDVDPAPSWIKPKKPAPALKRI